MPPNNQPVKKIICLLVLGVLGFGLLVRSAPALSPDVAREYLKNGALVIDVRTVAEFQAKHLTNVINIPLGDLQAGLPRQITNRAQVLLLHCRSGHRSGLAEAKLRAMGYTNTFNLGSYEQARSTLQQ